MATIRIPTPLRKLTQGKEEVTATGSTIGALITSLETQYPGIKERICDESGQVRRFVQSVSERAPCQSLQARRVGIININDSHIGRARAGS